MNPKYRLNMIEEKLWDEDVAVHIPPKALLLLHFFVSNPSRLLTKSEILDAIWPNRFVCESVIKDYVRLLRTTLNDDYRNPEYIETVHRRGYRFIGNILLIRTSKLIFEDTSVKSDSTATELADTTGGITIERITCNGFESVYQTKSLTVSFNT